MSSQSTTSLYANGTSRLRIDESLKHLSDFTLRHENGVDVEEFRVHKSVIALHSSKFAEFLQQHPESTMLKLSEVQFPRAGLKQVLDFFYSGQPDLSADTAYSTYRICRMVGANSAATMVLNWMQDNVTGNAALLRIISQAARDGETDASGMLMKKLQPKEPETSTATNETQVKPIDGTQARPWMPQFSTTERVCKDVPEPAKQPLAHTELFDPDCNIRIEVLRQHFIREGRLLVTDVLEIISRARKILSAEPNVLEVEDTVTVVGDIHGQYYDMMKMLEITGMPPETNFLFLGDYVDRGSFSCEVILLLLAMKVQHPTRVAMLRGNHECRYLTEHFTFLMECKKKYNREVYEAFIDVFTCLPLAAVIDKKFFAVHGGLSPDIRTLDDIRALHRFREPPTSGALCDLLWADPMPDDSESGMFAANMTRGCSYTFGYAAAVRFLEENGLLTIIRAHEVVEQGYRFSRTNPKTRFPTVITLFSAPNFVDMYTNVAAVLRIKGTKVDIRQFREVPHPFILPEFMNGIEWSLPFVAEQVTRIFQDLLAVCTAEDDLEDINPASVARADVSSPTAAARVKQKIRVLGRFASILKTIRQEHTHLVRLKQLSPSHSAPPGVLMAGHEGIQQALTKFDAFKISDLPGESLPPPDEHSECKLQ